MQQEIPDRRQRRRDQTREEILAAAWALAERDGIATLSLRDLAGRVGMRAPSLYTYFDSKAAIYDAMFAQGYRKLDAFFASFDVDERDPVGSLASSMEQFLEFCVASIPRYQLLFTRVIADWEPSQDAYALSVAAYDRMAQLLGRLGIRERADLDLWTAIGGGLAAQQVANDPRGDRWIRLTREVAQMYLAHLDRKEQTP